MIRTERVQILKEHLREIGITVMTIADITAWAGHGKNKAAAKGISNIVRPNSYGQG